MRSIHFEARDEFARESVVLLLLHLAEKNCRNAE